MRKKSLYLKIFFLVLFAVLALLFYLGMKAFSFYNKISTVSHLSPAALSATPKEKNIYSILLAGYGGGTHEGTYLTDTLMVVRIDTKAKKATLISLPRDLWVEIPTKTNEGFHEKINAAYQMAINSKRYPAIDQKYAGKENAGLLLKEVVSGVVGFPVDAYVTIDFEGFVKTVDLLGGVDVEVEKTFDDYEYPIDGKENDLCEKTEADLPSLLLTVTVSPREAFPCRYEHLHFESGKTHMDGLTALKYVRSRHSLQDGTDFGRAARQQRFLQAVRSKVVSVGFLPKIIPLMEELGNYIRTDVPFADMQKLLAEAAKGEQYKISSFIPTDADYLTPSRSSYGGYILIPRGGIDKWEGLQEAIDNVIKGTPAPKASASATLKEKN